MLQKVNFSYHLICFYKLSKLEQVSPTDYSECCILE
jgi:hypothetical protein